MDSATQSAGKTGGDGLNMAFVQALKDTPTALISDARQRLTGIVGLTRIDTGGPTVGRALTVKTRAADNLVLYKAMTIAKPGDFLIIDAGGDPNHAVVGGLIALQLERLGCVGFAIDGAVRDVAELRRYTNFACYTKAVSHKGPYKSGPGAVNVPVSVCGQIINPGDIIVADHDGLVSFPVDEVEGVLRAVAERRHHEAAIVSEIEAHPRSLQWVRRILEAADESGIIVG